MFKGGFLVIEITDTLKKIKVKQGIPEDNMENDEIIILMIQDTVQAICDYCHREPCPDKLEYLVREIVNKTIELDNDGNIASIKRGDTQINYNTTITTDSFTDKQIKSMNNYRKLRIH